MKSGPCGCLTSTCVKNLPTAFVVVWMLLCTFCHPFLTSYGVSYFLIPHSLWPTPFRGRALLDFGIFFLQPTLLLIFVVLLPFYAVPFCHSCCDVIWPQPVGPFCACCLFFSQWLSKVIGLFTTLLAGSYIPFISSWASLAHLLSLGFLGPFPNSAFPWVFTNSFGLLWPNYLILHP